MITAHADPLADTVVFRGGLHLVPNRLHDTVRIDRPLPAVPALSARRPAVTGMDPAGRRVTMIPVRPAARAYWAPVRHAGYVVGGTLACLAPVAFAITQILGGQA